jgi:hypothetical protein
MMIYRQNKLLKVALEKNNEQVQELNQIVSQPQNTRNHLDMFSEFRLDNEVHRIINQSSPSKRNLAVYKKHHTSAIHQESTDIATDEYTARVSNKLQIETPDQKLSKATSREVILPTQTIPESSTQNEDLRIINESVRQEPENVQKHTEFLDYIKYLLENDEENSSEDIITEIEKQFLLDNKDFEDELEEIKFEIREREDEIRQLKKQKYCVLWPNTQPKSQTSPGAFSDNEQIIDKNGLQETFLDFCSDIRKEVLKTRFINGTPSLESQYRRFSGPEATASKQDKNIQSILDLVVTNDDLLNKFYDIIFNVDNQALKLPQVHSGDNKK